MAYDDANDSYEKDDEPQLDSEQSYESSERSERGVKRGHSRSDRSLKKQRHDSMSFLDFGGTQ